MKNNYIIKDDINLIKSNRLLFHAYKIKFDLIKKHIGKKNILEIGSGSGIAKYFLKNTKTSDLRKNPNIDFVYNAYFDVLKKKKDFIFMVDVFHHLHRPNLVIKNLKKSLKKNGKIIIFEPYLSPMSFFFYFITFFFGPKERLGLFKKIDFSLSKKNLIEEFDFVTQPQKFFGSNNNKDIIKIDYILEYFFIFTGGVSFHKLQKLIPNFVYSFLLKIDDFLNKSKNSVIKKIFATKILIVLR